MQQCLSFLQIRRVKALAEPAKYRGKQVVCYASPALALPVSPQDHGRPQFQRFGLLASSYLYRTAKAWLRSARRRRSKQQFTVHPMDLGLEKPFMECAGMLRGELDPIKARRDAACLQTRIR
jgi:hypothetical protein